MIFLLKGLVKEILDKHTFLFMIKNFGFKCWINSTEKIKLYEEIELYFYVFFKMNKKQIFELFVFAFKKFLDLEFFNKLLSLEGVGIKTAQKIVCFSKEEIINKLKDSDSFNYLLKEIGINFKQALKLKQLLKINDEVVKDEYYFFVSETLINLGYKKENVHNILQKYWKQWKTMQIDELISLFAKKYVNEYSEI